MKLLNARSATGPQKLLREPVRAADAAAERLEAVMSENNITPEMRLQSLSDLKHSLVKRDMTTALSRADFAAFVNEGKDEVNRLYFMVKELDVLIKGLPLYKQVMLQCHRIISDGK